MSLQTPTTKKLSDQVVADLASSLGQTIPYLPKAFARVLAWVLAGAIVIVFKYAGFIFLQLFVAYATDDETVILGRKIRPLREWGRLLGAGDPLPAQRAELTVTVRVTNQVGDLAAGATLLRRETRVLYQVVAAVPLNAATVQARIKAIGDDAGGDGSGSIGNLAPGDILSFAALPPNVASDVTVVAQVVTGADGESVEVYRARIIQRARRRAQGGAYADYHQWGSEVPGIVNIYPYAGERPGGSGPGQVDVYVEASEASSGSEDGFPTTPQLDAVRDNINLNNVDGKATRRPVNAALNVLPISRVTFDFLVIGFGPDTPATRGDIEDALREWLRSREPFIEGLSVLPRDDRITKAAAGGIVDTAASANGATVASVNLLLSGLSIPAYTLEHGQKAKLGTVSYS